MRKPDEPLAKLIRPYRKGQVWGVRPRFYYPQFISDVKPNSQKVTRTDRGSHYFPSVYSIEQANRLGCRPVDRLGMIL